MRGDDPFVVEIISSSQDITSFRLNCAPDAKGRLRIVVFMVDVAAAANDFFDNFFGFADVFCRTSWTLSCSRGCILSYSNCFGCASRCSI